MKDLFSSFGTGRDPAGNLFVEFRLAIGITLIGLATTPIIIPLGYVLADAPLGYTWPVFAGYAFVILIDALGAWLMFWQRRKTRVLVSLDRKKSVVLIDDGEQREIPIGDIEKAEFGSAPSVQNPSVTHHRLEFVMRNNERTPATHGHYSVSQDDRAKLLEALNAELSLRRAML